MSESIKRINMLRNLYKSQSGSSSSEVVREIKNATNELKIANDLKVREETPITTKTGSPYLSDQSFHISSAIYGSPSETEWKEVKSYEQTKNEALTFKNLRRLLIL